MEKKKSFFDNFKGGKPGSPKNSEDQINNGEKPVIWEKSKSLHTKSTQENVGYQPMYRGKEFVLGDFLDNIDAIIVKVAPFSNEFQDKSNVRPCYIVFGIVLFFFCTLGLGWGGGLVCDITAFLYPAWASFLAIESPSLEDDKQWLTYWVVYALFSLIEYVIDKILFWVPFYYMLKFTFLLYLALPCFKGAQVIYNSFVRPYLLHHKHRIHDHLEHFGGAAAKVVNGITQEGTTFLANQGIGAAMLHRPPSLKGFREDY